jgi:molybdopterin-guanine dinucleotide biosynthesis protein A
VIDHNLPRDWCFSTVDTQRLLSTAKVSTSGLSRAASVSLTAVLFVGGESRRMGSDKALLTCSTGEPLWSKQLRLLDTLHPQFTWISGRTVPAWCPVGVEVVLDVPPSRGPLSGLCACLARLETTHLLALAIDMPRMTTKHLCTLRAMAQAGHSLIPSNGRSFEPLCAIYSKSVESVAAGLLGRGDNSLQTFAKALVERKLATPYYLSAIEKPLYLNVNRPEDFSRIQH